MSLSCLVLDYRKIGKHRIWYSHQHRAPVSLNKRHYRHIYHQKVVMELVAFELVALELMVPDLDLDLGLAVLVSDLGLVQVYSFLVYLQYNTSELGQSRYLVDMLQY